MSPKSVALLALVAFLHLTSATQDQHGNPPFARNAVVTQLQKSVDDILAGFQQFSSHLERKLASVQRKMVTSETPSSQVLNTGYDNVQKRSTDQETDSSRSSVNCSMCDQLIAQVKELGNNLNSKLKALEVHANSTGCAQYLPTSCQDIADKWPKSASGHYQILSGNGTVITLYCYITSASKPVSSCEDIMSQNWTIPAGKYWVTIENGSSQIYCPSYSQPAPFCKHLFEKNPLTPAGVYWVRNETTQAVHKTFCTSSQHPADSCDTVLESHPTILPGDYWIKEEGKSKKLYCLRNDEKHPGGSCKPIFSLSPTIPPGLYWVEEKGVVFCDSEDRPATSCESVLQLFNNFTDKFRAYWVKDGNFSSQKICTSESHRWPGPCEQLLSISSGVKAGLYWIKDHSSQVYCTSEEKPASSCDQILEASDTVLARPHWISIENNLDIDLSMQELYGENCSSHNRTAVQFYCSSWKHPAPACESFFDYFCPTNPPGLYWIDTPSGSPACVYCTPHTQCCNSTGGWMRAKYLNMSDPIQSCPYKFTPRINSNKRTCARQNTNECTSIHVHTYGVEYNEVCGKLIAYQIGTTKAFRCNVNTNMTSDDPYVDGVSITHGQVNNRTHIWTFAAAADELLADSWTCPCSKNETFTGTLPGFIKNDYFCDSGYDGTGGYTMYQENPLWDGAGCGPDSSCCTFNSPPWFCKALSQPTTEDIEVRVCTTRSQCDISLEMVELYVR